MRKWQRDVQAFFEIAGQPFPSEVDFANWPGNMRLKLIFEEAHEMRRAWFALLGADAKHQPTETHEAGIVDGIIDLLYVTIGAAVALGIDIDPFFDEVHAANMRKFPGGIVLKRPDGKILKPAGWRGPNMMARLLEAKSKP